MKNFDAGFIYKIFAFIPLALLLVGCSIGWSRPGANRSDFNQETYACQREAARMYPFAVQRPTTYVGSGETHCSTMFGTTNCTTDASIAPIGSGVDMNLTNRNIAFGQCMHARGWEWGVSQNQSAPATNKNSAERGMCFSGCTTEECNQHCWAYYPKTN